MDNRFQGKICPFCKSGFTDRDEIVVCSVCEMPHHLSCWQENHGCTTFGCTGVIREMISARTGSVRTTSVSAAPTPAQTQPPAAPAEKTAKRFEVIFTREPYAVWGGAPVLLENVSLLLDHRDDSVAARCVFRSLSERPILAVLVDVACRDVWGNTLTPVEGFQYLDLKTKRDSTFGQTKPIPIPDAATRAVEVTVRKVMYTDRTMQEASAEADVLPRQETLAAHFGDEALAKEYVRETNENARYIVTQSRDYWLCACGAANPQTAAFCYKCGAEKERLQQLLDTEQLAVGLAAHEEALRQEAERQRLEREERLRQAEERLQQQKEEQARLEREEAERKAEERRRKKAKRRKILLCALLAVFAGFLVYATGWHIIPYIRYQNACKALEAQAYDEAYETFVALDEFSDSPERAVEALYGKATVRMDSGAYTEAAEMFERIPDYLDSAEQATHCRNEAAYLEANALLDAGKYYEAAEAFTELKDYSDSRDKAQEAKYMYAQKCFDAGDYEHAAAAYTELGDYKDAKKRLPEANYRYALALQEQFEWKAARSLFKKLGDYEDSAQRYQETSYQYGLELLADRDYSHAANVFKELDGYQDSNDKLNEAKYGYVLANRNNENFQTYFYLKDLKAINYRDAPEIYEELYSWHVTMVFNTSESDKKTNLSSISKYDTVYCHIEVTGGPPNESINLKYVYVWPRSAAKSNEWSYPWYAGQTGWFNTWYNTPSKGATGTFTAKIYNKDTGELLASATITITN